MVAFSTDNGSSITADGRHSVTIRPGRDGTFSFSGLLPGDYYVSAVEYADRDRDSDPEYLRTLANGASRVTLGAGDQRTLTLKVASAPQ